MPVRSQKNYTLQEFLKASDKELLEHKQELDSLIEQKKLNLPQSQAVLFYPDPIANRSILQNPDYNQSKKGKSLSQEGVIKAVNDAIKTENKENAQGHLVLYHSTQPNLYAQSYIHTQLQKLALELKGKKIDTETLLMRDLNKSRNYEKEKAKRKEFLKYTGSIKDTRPSIAKYLISTNPAITSNTIQPYESTLFYFLEKYNVNKSEAEADLPPFIPKGNKLLEQTLQTQNQELSEAFKKFNNETNTGILLQFIVKDDNLGRKILYNAQPLGRKNYVDLYGEEETDPTTILNTMRTDPAAFNKMLTSYESLGKQQMRLVVTGDKLLDLENPAMKEFDVKAYSGSDQSLKEFQKKVDDTIQKIRSDYYAQKQQMSWPKRIQYGAIDLYHKRQSPWEQRQQYKRMMRGDIGSPFE